MTKQTEIMNSHNDTPRLFNTIGTLVTEIALEAAEAEGLAHMTDGLLVTVDGSGRLPRLLTFPVGSRFTAVAIMDQRRKGELVGKINIFLVEDLSCAVDETVFNGYQRSAQVRFCIKDGFLVGQDDLRDVTEVSVESHRRQQVVDALTEATYLSVVEDLD